MRAPVAWWIRELTLNPLGFSPLWFEPSSGHMWESQVLLTDGQVVFLRVLRFSPTFDERSARYKWNILERAVKPKSKKKKKKKNHITYYCGFHKLLTWKKDLRLYWGSSKVMFKKISQNFVKSPLKIWPYLTDFSPQLMACMCSCCILWGGLTPQF